MLNVTCIGQEFSRGTRPGVTVTPALNAPNKARINMFSYNPGSAWARSASKEINL